MIFLLSVYIVFVVLGIKGLFKARKNMTIEEAMKGTRLDEQETKVVYTILCTLATILTILIMLWAVGKISSPILTLVAAITLIVKIYGFFKDLKGIGEGVLIINPIIMSLYLLTFNSYILYRLINIVLKGE